MPRVTDLWPQVKIMRSMSDDAYTCPFSINELGSCELTECSNTATEIIDIVIPWKPGELGKWYLCKKCKQEMVTRN
jgi:hypothetical protein